MCYTNINFGKYKNNTLPQVIFQDADWFYNALLNDDFINKGNEILMEAIDIFYKAGKIKIPDDTLVEYTIKTPPNEKFLNFRFIPSNQPINSGCTFTDKFRLDYLDMSIPPRCAKYVKSDSMKFVQIMKSWLWDDKSIKLTKKFCENFFDDPNNFK
jgi:hypothetical protein